MRPGDQAAIAAHGQDDPAGYAAEAGMPAGRFADGASETAPETSMVRLVQFPLVWGMNASPFCLKLETWLRLAGLPFEIRTSINTQKAPKRKLPFIVDGGVEIGDSTLIIRHLKKTRGIDPDASLDARARAECTALQRLFEDHLYYILAYSRFVDPEGWQTVGEGYFALLPGVLRPFGRLFMRTAVRRALNGQGISRHAPADVYALGRRDLEAVAARLGTQPFFMGEQLTSIDAVAYGFLANIIKVPVETELKRAALEFPELVHWCDTMEAGLYGDP